MQTAKWNPHFGKVRLYVCDCGATCFRELHYPPHPCSVCGQGLEDRTYTIDDVIVSARNMDHVGCICG